MVKMADYDADWQSNILPAATESGKALEWVRKDPAYAMRSSNFGPATKIGPMPELMRKSYPSQQAAPRVAHEHHIYGEISTPHHTNGEISAKRTQISAWGPTAGREGVRKRFLTPADPCQIARNCLEEGAARRGQRFWNVDPTERAMADPGRLAVNDRYAMEDRRMYGLETHSHQCNGTSHDGSCVGQRSAAELIEQRTYYESLLREAWEDVKRCMEQKNNAVHELRIVNQQLSRVFKERDMLKEMYVEQSLSFEKTRADAGNKSKEAIAQLKQENEKLKIRLDQLIENCGLQQAAKPSGIGIGTSEKPVDEGPRIAIVKPSAGPSNQQSTVAAGRSSSLGTTVAPCSSKPATGTLPIVLGSAVESRNEKEKGAIEDTQVASDAVEAVLEAQPQHQHQHQQQQQQRRQQWRRSSQQQQHHYWVQGQQQQQWRRLSHQQQHYRRVHTRQQQHGSDRDILAIDWWLARVKVKWKSSDHHDSVRTTGQVDRCTMPDAVLRMPNSIA